MHSEFAQKTHLIRESAEGERTSILGCLARVRARIKKEVSAERVIFGQITIMRASRKRGRRNGNAREAENV